MAVGASPKIGDSCENCLKKFTLHFRRSDDMAYDGSYGFDWYRTEFFNSMTFDQKESNNDLTNKKPLVKGDIQSLKNSYVAGQKTSMSPFGVEYIPAWLAISPNIQKDGLQYNNQGVWLNLELIPLTSEQDFNLENDGTIIKLEPTSEMIKVQPSEFQIDEFMRNKQQERGINFKPYKKEIYYELQNFLNIKCTGTFEQHEEINVYAIKGETKEKIGKLMLYHNAKIPTLKIQLVDIITDGRRLQRDYNYQDFLKYRAFNQALINIEIVEENAFDMRKYRKNDHEVDICLARLEARFTTYFLGDVHKIFMKYRDASYISKHYVLLTTVDMGTALGAGGLGNEVRLFLGAEKNFNTVLTHELAHSLKLPHTFESNSIGVKGKSFSFIKGKTINFLDYSYEKREEKVGRNQGNGESPLKYFFKFQWDAMRKRLGA